MKVTTLGCAPSQGVPVIGLLWGLLQSVKLEEPPQRPINRRLGRRQEYPG